MTNIEMVRGTLAVKPVEEDSENSYFKTTNDTSFMGIVEFVGSGTTLKFDGAYRPINVGDKVFYKKQYQEFIVNGKKLKFMEADNIWALATD